MWGIEFISGSITNYGILAISATKYRYSLTIIIKEVVRLK